MLNSKTFSTADQAWFAALTGDCNPMHMDPIYARRTQAGAPVVHGIHILLWLIDWVGRHNRDIEQAVSLKAGFAHMVYLGDHVEARIVEKTSRFIHAQAYVGTQAVLSVEIGLGLRSTIGPPSRITSTAAAPRRDRPADLTMREMENLSGRVTACAAEQDFECAFPEATRLLGADRVMALGSSTYLVGMVVPGLHSVYSSLDLLLTVDAYPTNELQFVVTAVDERFRLVHLRIEGSGISGTLDAFSRMPPVLQPSMSEVAKCVDPAMFATSVALVVGGSRGLGEITAKIIAAGGGRVIITYATGRSDADKVAADIGQWGGKCDVMVYDVRAEAARQLESLNGKPTHLYYFATPPIFGRKSRLFSRERFEEFNEFYLYGFLSLVEAMTRRIPEGFVAFYPSTVAVRDRPKHMSEYAMSKAAGEVLCAAIARSYVKVRVLQERLPRILTDQTTSLIPAESVSSLAVMLPIIRKMQEPRSPS